MNLLTEDFWPICSKNCQDKKQVATIWENDYNHQFQQQQSFQQQSTGWRMLT